MSITIEKGTLLEDGGCNCCKANTHLSSDGSCLIREYSDVLVVKLGYNTTVLCEDCANELYGVTKEFFGSQATAKILKTCRDCPNMEIKHVDNARFATCNISNAVVPHYSDSSIVRFYRVPQTCLRSDLEVTKSMVGVNYNEVMT